MPIQTDSPISLKNSPYQFVRPNEICVYSTVTDLVRIYFLECVPGTCLRRAMYDNAGRSRWLLLSPLKVPLLILDTYSFTLSPFRLVEFRNNTSCKQILSESLDRGRVKNVESRTVQLKWIHSLTFLTVERELRVKKVSRVTDNKIGCGKTANNARAAVVIDL